MNDITRLQKLAGIPSTHVPVLQEIELKDLTVNEDSEEEKYERLENVYHTSGEAGLAKELGMTEAQLNDIIDALASESHEWARQVLTADDDREVIIDRIMDLAADGQFDDHHFSKWDEDTNEGWGLDLVKGIGKGFKKGYKRLSRLGSKNTKDKYDGEGGFIGTDTTWNEDDTNEAVGEFAEPLYTLQDDLGLEDNILVDELARWMDAQDITAFVENFRRHHDMNHPGEDGDYGEDDKNFEAVKEDEADQLSDCCDAAPIGDIDDDGQARCSECMDYSTFSPVEESIKEAQSPAQKAAFAKMLAAKNGGKDESVDEAKAKPDYADIDGDGDEEETMKKAAKDKEDKEVTEETVTEAPTMDTTQLITLMKNAGLSEEAIEEKINEWANSPENASETEATSHGDAYDFAQNVNTSLKKYLDAQDMKVGITEHTVEELTEKYQESKDKV